MINSLTLFTKPYIQWQKLFHEGTLSLLEWLMEFRRAVGCSWARTRLPGLFFSLRSFLGEWTRARAHIRRTLSTFNQLQKCLLPISFFFFFCFLLPSFICQTWHLTSRISYTNLKIKKIPYPESVVAFRVSSAFCLLLCSICELNSILVLGPFAVFLFPSFLRRPRHETQTD